MRIRTLSDHPPTPRQNAPDAVWPPACTTAATRRSHLHRLHRLTAVSDMVFAEASTAAPGWREDVVRIADRYGRDGTTSP